jgi:UPF0755 protein
VSSYRDRDYREREYRERNDRVRERRSAAGGSQSTADHVTNVIKYVLIAVAVLVIISASRQAYAIGYAVFAQTAVDTKQNAKEVTVEITADMSVKEIGGLLEKDGLLKDGSLFPYQEKFSSWHGKIKPGTYKLSTDMTPEDMLKIMAGGNDTPDTGGDTSSAGETESTEASAEPSSVEDGTAQSGTDMQAP